MEERKALRCPLCGAEMTGGDVVCKTGAGPTLYPRVEKIPLVKRLYSRMDRMAPSQLYATG